jgi:diacylglycerol kinase (ATP)
VIPCSNPHDLLSIFLHAAAGEHLQVEGVMNCRAKSILIESESPIPLQLDGEAAGHTPTDIHLIPGGVRFIVPCE